VNEANDTQDTTGRLGPEPLTVACQQDGDTYSVVPCGEIDVASAPVLEAELRRIESLAPSSILLDLSRLTFMDSTGIRLFAAAHERATQGPYSISFLRGPPIIQRVIEMSGLQSVLTFAD
jgi:anti-anti-sigma factor